MKRICDFATGNAHTIVLIYAIVAVIVWVAVNLYFWKISFDLDREIREEMREYGDCYSDTDEAKFGKHITRLTGFIISIPAAVMWWCKKRIRNFADSKQTILTRRKTNDFKLRT